MKTNHADRPRSIDDARSTTYAAQELDYSAMGAYNIGFEDGEKWSAQDIARLESKLRQANARIMKLQGIILDILPMVPYEQRVYARNMFMAAHAPAITFNSQEVET